jgi:beta-hydroxylase
MNNDLCKSDYPYKLKKNNFSYNKNDTIGLLNNLLIILFITFIFIKNNNNKKNYLYVSLLCLFIFIVRIYHKPIGIVYMVSSLITLVTRTPEFLDKDKYFPNNYLFEKPENFKILKKEVEDLISKTDNGDSLLMMSKTLNGANEVVGSYRNIINDKVKAWRFVNIKIGKEFTKDAYQHFPFLVKLLEDLPEVTACAISVLQEGVRIPIHTGYYKGIMRYMMPIIVPKDRDNVFLCVNEKKYNWTEGEGVLWDDNFPHKVYNNTNEIRVVIFMDIIRPLCGVANYLNKQFINLISNTKIIKDEIKKTEIQIKQN